VKHPGENIFDVAVIGGGPAGAITAFCLARLGWRTAIFECTAFDKNRYGETLPPEINPLLRDLGLWDAFISLGPVESPGIISTWGSPQPVEIDFVANAYGCGWHIDRNRFDMMLCQQAVEAGATLLLNRRLKWTAEERGWRADEFQAGFLVHANGRHGIISRKSRPGGLEDELLAIVLRVAGGKELRDRRTLIETVPSGWWYSALLPDGTVLAMLFTGIEIYRGQEISIGADLAAAPLTRQRFEGGRLCMAPKIVYTPCGLRAPMFGERWLAVGDSASAYDPLSGRGIFKAFNHGKAAAKAIDSVLSDSGAMEQYESQVRLEFEAYSRQRLQFYGNEGRWPNQPFWRARSSKG
jgi:flavin-dependent dehydrogenase